MSMCAEIHCIRHIRLACVMSEAGIVEYDELQDNNRYLCDANIGNFNLCSLEDA